MLRPQSRLLGRVRFLRHHGRGLTRRQPVPPHPSHSQLLAQRRAQPSASWSGCHPVPVGAPATCFFLVFLFYPRTTGIGIGQS